MDNDFYKQILVDSPIGYAYHQILCDEEGLPYDYKFIEVNPAFEKLTGLRGGDIIGRRVTEILPRIRDNEFDWVKIYGEIALHGGNKEFEQFSECLNKTYRVNVYSPEKYYFITHVIDISKEIEQVREQANINIEREVENKQSRWNELFLNLMTSTSPLAFFVVDNRTDKILYFNHKFCEIWGITHLEEQMQRGELTNNQIIPDCLPMLMDIPAFTESCKPLQSEENRINIEDDIPFINGRIIHRYSTQMRGLNDEYFGRFYIFEEITERKNMEYTLREREQNFHTFFETMDDMIMVANRQGKLFYTNGAVSNKLGYIREELQEMHIFDIHTVEKGIEAEQILGEIFEGKRRSCELPLARKDGIAIPVETRAWFGTWDGKDCVFGISKDLSLQQAALDKFYKLFENNPNLIAVSSFPERRIMEVNAAFLNKLGFSKEEVIGKTSKELDLFVDPNSLLEMEKMLQQEGRLKNVETKVRKKDGQFLDGLFSGEIIDNQLEKTVLIVMTDVTAIKQTEKKLQEISIRLEEAAITATKLAAQAENANVMKSQFLANMSHEIRTPMHGIIGFLELLNMSNLSAEQRDFIREAQNASEVLLYLINDILDLSKIEAGKLKMEKIDFNLRAAIEDTVSLFVPKANEKNIVIHTRVKKSVPEEVIGDPARLRQILNNFISNAVKFTERGEVTVTVDCMEKDKDMVLLNFEIKDTGIGICQENIHKLFQSFTQADSSITRKYGGTGLGLTISKELVNLMEGTIHVESTVGEGSLFSFGVHLAMGKKPLLQGVMVEKFPQENGQRVDDHERNSKTLNLCLTGVSRDGVVDNDMLKPRILVVEDNKVNCKIITTMFKSKNMTCDVVMDGSEALAAVMKKDYDIIFMDCQMPIMDGYESTMQIRKLEGNTKRTRIVAMTANAMEGDREKCIAVGMDDYISKPIQFKTLFAMVEESMKKSS